MKTKYIILISVLIIGVTSCKKFVQISPPTTELVTANVFSDNASATAAQIAIYSKMVGSESANMALLTGLLGDELTNYSSNVEYVQFYTNAMTASAGNGPWINAYNYIYQANAVISAIQGNPALSPAVVQQLLGEATFVRAFWYFYLTNLYGAVPLALTTNYNTNASLKRTAGTEVYQQIVTDLKAAQGLLNPNYVDASDTTVITTDRGRPTKWAAAALLARVYLYTGDYADAAIEADSVIGNTGLYSLCTNLNNVFLVNSTEAIWQLDIPLPTTINTGDAKIFILLSAPGTSSNCCSLSSQLLNSFEPGDYRRANWVDSFVTTSTPAVTYYYPYKYKVYSSATVTEDVMVLRLAEQYLIRAEAEVNGAGNGVAAAISDLNIIRNRAGLPNYGGATDQASVLTAILHERQVELFTEWGHRWLDIIRTGAADTIMGPPGNVTQFKSNSTKTWAASDTLYPIPQKDLTADPNLTQNLGY
jgi:hypothetical protein